MKDYIKKMVLMAAVLLLACMMIPGLSAKTEAAESESGTEGVRARIVVPEEQVFGAVTYTAASGIVEGTGVRLRAKPSSSSTVLELMYNGEYVNIYYPASTAKWFYVNRLKTGTRGYASKDYILAL